MHTMHLFAGAGGGLLADLILGHEPVVAVEWESHACEVLRQRASQGWFPGLQVFEGDVRLFDPSEYAGRVDCIHAGFPCQPFSAAGKRKGTGDERDLFWEVRRCVQAVRPQYVFLENVPGLCSVKTGTCVCGWPYRRGGLHSHSETIEQAKLYAGRADEHDRQGGGDTACASGAFWRAVIQGSIQQAGEMGDPVAVAYQWGRSISVFEGDPSVPVPETGAGGSGNAAMGHDADAGAERARSSLDERGQGESGITQAEDARTEQEGARCPECGSGLVSAESELVWYVGAIHGALAEIGYDCCWTTLSASDVGALHQRNRWWCLAWRRDVADTLGDDAQGFERGGLDAGGREIAGAGSPGSCGDGEGRRATEPGLGGLADGLAAGMGSGWWMEEPGVGRVTTEKDQRRQRLMELGNGQVPLQAAAAFTILWEMMEATHERT